ncbi:hypothetical protein JW898_05845 [Candidatus Woesearchaeota archaeon]|nr:hypothetical protein [Candidatus Woesearchaeota archaeon]
MFSGSSARRIEEQIDEIQKLADIEFVLRFHRETIGPNGLVDHLYLDLSDNIKSDPERPALVEALRKAIRCDEFYQSIDYIALDIKNRRTSKTDFYKAVDFAATTQNRHVDGQKTKRIFVASISDVTRVAGKILEHVAYIERNEFLLPMIVSVDGLDYFHNSAKDGSFVEPQFRPSFYSTFYRETHGFREWVEATARMMSFFH